MIGSLGISKFILISALAMSGFNCPTDFPTTISDDQATTAVRNLLPDENKTLFDELVKADNTSNELTEEQRKNLQLIINRTSEQLIYSSSPWG